MKTLAMTMTILALPAWLLAQEIQFDFDALAAKAKEKVEINFDEAVVASAKQLLGGDAAKLPAGLKSGFLRAYEFEKPGAFSNADLEAIRKQVSSGWKTVMRVKEDEESFEILMRSGTGGQPPAFFVLAVEPKELLVIYAVGDLKLAELQGLVYSGVTDDRRAALR